MRKRQVKKTIIAESVKSYLIKDDQNFRESYIKDVEDIANGLVDVDGFSRVKASVMFLNAFCVKNRISIRTVKRWLNPSSQYYQDKFAEIVEHLKNRGAVSFVWDATMKEGPFESLKGSVDNKMIQIGLYVFYGFRMPREQVCNVQIKSRPEALPVDTSHGA